MRFYFLFFLIALMGCSQDGLETQARVNQWMTPNGKLKILSTTGMIGDLVKQIVGDHGDTLVLIGPELDPHSYQLVKGDDEKLMMADVIFSNGLGLEHGPSLCHFLKRGKCVAVGNDLLQHYPDQLLYLDGVVDPHVWMDIALWSLTIPSIVDALTEVDPDHAAEYRLKGLALQSRMQAEHMAVQHKLRSIPEEKRYLVTCHDAFSYFTRAYLADEEEQKSGAWERRFRAPEGLAPDSQLSLADIKEILQFLEKHRVGVVFPESNVSHDSLRKIALVARQKGLSVMIADETLYGDAMGGAGSPGETYLQMIRHNASVLLKYLEKNYGN